MHGEERRSSDRNTSRNLYRTIVVDPPWRYKTTLAVTGNAPGRTRQRGRSRPKYDKDMTIEEIAALNVKSLAADDCHLYLWTTNTHVEFSWWIVRHWGFTPKNLLTWCKRPKGMIGFGTFSQASEFVLFAQRGKPSMRLARCERTWWEWARTKNLAQKPEAFFEVVERVSPTPRIELFARRRREGWHVWGNEVDSDIDFNEGGNGVEPGFKIEEILLVSHDRYSVERRVSAEILISEEQDGSKNQS